MKNTGNKTLPVNKPHIEYYSPYCEYKEKNYEKCEHHHDKSVMPVFSYIFITAVYPYAQTQKEWENG